MLCRKTSTNLPLKSQDVDSYEPFHQLNGVLDAAITLALPDRGTLWSRTRPKSPQQILPEGLRRRLAVALHNARRSHSHIFGGSEDPFACRLIRHALHRDNKCSHRAIGDRLEDHHLHKGLGLSPPEEGVVEVELLEPMFISIVMESAMRRVIAASLNTYRAPTPVW